MTDLEDVTAELSDIADQLDQMGEVFNSDWPIKMSDRLREVTLQLIRNSEKDRCVRCRVSIADDLCREHRCDDTDHEGLDA